MISAKWNVTRAKVGVQISCNKFEPSAPATRRGDHALYIRVMGKRQWARAMQKSITSCMALRSRLSGKIASASRAMAP